MRNKYKNLQRVQSPNNNNNEVLLSNKKSNNTNNNILNNSNKNTFIFKYERREKNDKIISQNNDKEKEKKRIGFNKQYLLEKINDIKDSEQNKTKNEDILNPKYKYKDINGYKKLKDNKRNSINTSTNNKNNNINLNCSLNKDYQNINKSINNNINRNNQNDLGSKIISSNRKQNQNQSEQNRKKLEIIEIKNQGNKDRNTYTNQNSVLNFRKNKYSSSFINISKAQIDDESNNNIKNINNNQEIKNQKINNLYSESTHNFSLNNISNFNRTHKINSINNTNNINNISNISNENNDDNRKRTFNFRKLRVRERERENNEKDNKTANSQPTSTCFLSPNINESEKINVKYNYRSKRISNNNNISQGSENTEINSFDFKKKLLENKDNNFNNKIKKNYVIKVTKTPNEINNLKDIENDIKTEDTNVNKKKIRHFLYFNSNKNMIENIKKDEKQTSNLLSGVIRSQSDINSQENSDRIITKNRVKNINISPKKTFHFLVKENNQKKKLNNSSKNNEDLKDYHKRNYNINNNDSINNHEIILNEQDMNNTFSYISQGLGLDLSNKKNHLFNLNNEYNSNYRNRNLRYNSNRNIHNNNFNKIRNNSFNNKDRNRAHSPSNINIKKKMNEMKSDSNYKENIDNESPNNSFSPSRSQNYEKISIKTIKALNSPYATHNITNNIINNNTYNTTLNIFKLSSKDKKDIDNIIITNLKKDKRQERKELSVKDNKDKKSSRTNSDFSQMKTSLYLSSVNENNLNQNVSVSNKKSSSKSLSEIINKSTIKNNDNCNENNNKDYDNNRIDLEIIYILESKLENVIFKINKYSVCNNECFDLITYYFNCKFYDKEIKLFKSKHNINNISYYIKFELLCYFLCYDVCFNKSFNQTGILLKTIIGLLYSDYLMIISYILNDEKNYKNGNNNENIKLWIYKLKNLIDKNLKNKLSPKDYSEMGILTLIGNNLKEANNYYKIIIDNLYSHFYTKKNNKKNYNDNKYKFPNCLQLDINDLDYYEKLNIISLFFFDAYRLLNNYNFEDLKYFFDSFLQRIKCRDQLNIENIINSNSSKNSSKNKVFNIKSVVIYKYNYSNGNFYYLPPMKKCYKYTLVLDLDETLVYMMPNDLYLNSLVKMPDSKRTLIFRPGLINFLQKMKPLYELVIFSFGTYQYVENVIKIIEKKEKFFEHVLYRQHATVSDNEYIKDLSLLGRDLKNIVIVDDIQRVFKLQERNGICIKAFYGDTLTDKNTLNFLGKILETIRFDAEETGDIRKSLDKQRNLIFTHITTNLE